MGSKSKNPTGMFFHEQTPHAVVDAIERFEQKRNAISLVACRNNALGFSNQRFRTEFEKFVNNVVANWPPDTHDQSL